MGAEAVPLLGAWPAPDDGRRRRPCPWRTICHYVLLAVFASLVLLLCVGVIAYIAYGIATNGAVEYSVAITGVDGLDPSIDLKSDLRTTLSPVFNLTIYIKEFDQMIVAECIGGHSTELTVTYRDAFLGKGAVPMFCVPVMHDDGVATKAWGVDVVVPRFLRDQLAGELERAEAVLDVVVSDRRFGNQMLACKAKIGGDRCPCEFEYS
jgi:hypothetical protein